MASSRVMASSSSANSDLPRQSSIHSLPVADLHGAQSKSLGSMNMEELLTNIYGDVAAENGCGTGFRVYPSSQGTLILPTGVENKTADEVWKEIVAGSGGVSREQEMTLEDFLTKAGDVRKEDVRIPVMPRPSLGFSGDSMMMNSAKFQDPPPNMESSLIGPGGYGVDSVGFGNRIDGRMVVVSAGISSGGAGRGKRKTAEEPPMDKATQQKHRRMIKNRESAARSRERNQAYTVELESLVIQLEEENSMLLIEELMVSLVPVVVKRRPPRSLRRMHSMRW